MPHSAVPETQGGTPTSSSSAIPPHFESLEGPDIEAACSLEQGITSDTQERMPVSDAQPTSKNPGGVSYQFPKQPYETLEKFKARTAPLLSLHQKAGLL
jgi:hypothetical protein